MVILIFIFLRYLELDVSNTPFKIQVSVGVSCNLAVDTYCNYVRTCHYHLLFIESEGVAPLAEFPFKKKEASAKVCGGHSVTGSFPEGGHVL